MRALFLLVLLLAAPVAAKPGSLVIVGGGLARSNAVIHKALLDRRPGDAPTIAIIPSASGAPADSARAFAEALITHGARPQDIVVVHLAAEDDPTTPGIDESRWAQNAADPAEIAKLANAGAIWFTGGDQLRTVNLLRPNGHETPMLAAIRKRLATGAVIGGSSAGAAIMSDTMITNGESMAALTRPVLRQAATDNRDENGQLVLGRGLGFLPSGLVDQHFDARARLGRLTRALFELTPASRIGFGVDEDTALVVDLATGKAQAIGAANVTLLDARGATRFGPRFAAEEIRLSVANGGDEIDMATLSVRTAPGKAPAKPEDGVVPLTTASAGMAVPAPPLAEFLASQLLARPDGPPVERLSFTGSTGVIFRFSRLAGSAATEGRDAHGRWRTTVQDAGFAIRPVDIEIIDIKTQEIRP